MEKVVEEEKGGCALIVYLGRARVALLTGVKKARY